MNAGKLIDWSETIWIFMLPSPKQYSRISSMVLNIVRRLTACQSARQSDIRWLIVMKEDPRLENLHSDPRFAALVRRIELRGREAVVERQP